MIEELFFFQYKIIPYLCGMKTSILFLSTVCALLQTMPAHAQFNTIGMTNSKSIKTINPSKSNETLTDSVVLNTPEQTSRETNESNEASNSSTGDCNMISLVSLPLKSIMVSIYMPDMRMCCRCCQVLCLKSGMTIALANM